MLYISKGVVVKQAERENMCVSHCGAGYMLTGIGARLWLGGRFGTNDVDGEREIRHLKELYRLGLTELSEESDSTAVYRLLTRCVICTAELKPVRKPLTDIENQVWQWISKAGLRLTVGELVKLFHDGVFPTPDLLGKESAQDLTLRIYAGDLYFDTTPDIQMEESPMRDNVVNAALSLLRKKRIILI